MEYFCRIDISENYFIDHSLHIPEQDFPLIYSTENKNKMVCRNKPISFTDVDKMEIDKNEKYFVVIE